MGGRGGSIGGSHGMKTAASAMTPAQALVAQIRADPSAILKMSDDDALTTLKTVAQQTIGQGEDDTFSQRYLNTIGWNDEKPNILKPSAYDAARKASGAVDMYHSVNDADGVSGATFNQQYMTGDRAYSFQGYFGGGTYWAAQSAAASAGYGKYQIKSFLNKKAKTVTLKQMDTLVLNFKQTHPKAYKYLFNTSSGYGDPDESMLSVVASAHKYNTILANNLSLIHI